MDSSSDSEHNGLTSVSRNDPYNPEEDEQPVFWTQVELKDLTRDLNLSKESTQQQGSHIKEKNLLAPGTKFYKY